ncbi:MAG: glycosyltransferase family 39 protein [Azospirillum sp.]|nr:glycosyltransferase family 39 protein [Azospirillum sp.]
MAQAQSLLRLCGRPAAVFALALGIRLLYLAWQGTSQADIFHPDTPWFVTLAAGPDWWQGSTERLPGYLIFLGLHFRIFGPSAFWAPLISQAVVDAMACVAIARTAECFRSGAGAWAGLLAAFNPTQIIMAGVLLGDSIFVACLSFGFLALARWWRGQGGAFVVGLWFGLALFNRAVLWPFIPVLGLALFAVGWRRGDYRAALVVLGIAMLFASPIVARNWIVWGTPSLSSQGPMHLALWWYPLVKEAYDGTPYARTAAAVSDAFERRGGGSGGFVDAALYESLAREGLAELPLSAFFKSWAMGAAINLASPATLMIPRVMALPRIGFYATEGVSPFDKILNFLTDSSSAAYLAWLSAGVALEGPIRLLAIAGLFLLLWRRETREAGLFILAWIGFVLMVQGPVASAKYRLPIESVAMVLAGYALAVWRDTKRMLSRA